MRAEERCSAFLRRENCADGLTCDRHGAPTTTLRKLQITMMMMDDARDDADAYLDFLRAYDDDDAAVLLTCVKKSMISVNKRTHTHATICCMQVLTCIPGARRQAKASREIKLEPLSA